MAREVKKQRVLVIEDCLSDVFLLENMLCEDPAVQIELVHVPRLIDAFQRIDEEIFDVILLDLNLLDIDGLASVAALNAEVPHVPIVVYSGLEDAKLKEKALMCGARDYLVKGRHDRNSLRRAIGNAMNQPRYYTLSAVAGMR